MGMKLRKLNRILHRDLGYFFFGMCIIYGISGIALNHLDDWNPNYIITNKEYNFTGLPDTYSKDNITGFLEKEQLYYNYKSHYKPSPGILKIFLDGGSLTIELATGRGHLEIIRKRPFFKELNYLHYNSIKKWYTWYADLYCVGLIIIAITGLFIIKGKKGITGRGAWLTIAGIAIPLIFLLVYH